MQIFRGEVLAWLGVLGLAGLLLPGGGSLAPPGASGEAPEVGLRVPARASPALAPFGRAAPRGPGGTWEQPGPDLPPLPAPARRVRYRKPVPGGVVRPFSLPAHRWLPGHRGVDLAAAAGSPVHAAGDGTVAFAGVVAGKPVVSLDHADGIRTTYEPVVASVQAGQAVRRGQVIGILQPGHLPDGDALHWGARRGRDRYLDPLTLLRELIVLKPP
ncbi:M23 family metallopeptidase [Buchananella hordeovulneris]|uniref:M23 family metallopeptidase n=1 Tax=Buchananella hordeovulneris TaxID=52770 RepID=UPI0026DB4047|nr:M23 family metallopeptidase [Buchananella hordeovulneris]MDO5080355.1 M23 family metallopeptidase [Buchananella hordeovulneris]